MGKFTKQRLSDMVATEIRNMIKIDQFGPGDKIYSENELTRRLGVSRASVREAIRILEVSGLLTVQQGRGIFLREQSTEEFNALAQYIHENADSLFEQFEIRLMIEPECAARAATSADSGATEELREIIRTFEAHCAAEEVEGAVTQDAKFHARLAKATGNRTLYVLMQTFARNLTEAWVTSLSLPGRQIKTISEHRAILDAIESGNAEAARSKMHDHLSNALREIRDYTEQVAAGHLPER